jgi:hypothetical protein
MTGHARRLDLPVQLRAHSDSELPDDPASALVRSKSTDLAPRAHDRRPLAARKLGASHQGGVAA